MSYDRTRFLLVLKDASGESKEEVRRRVAENEISGLISDIEGRDYSLSGSEVNFLRRYKQRLEEHEENAKKIKLVQENYAEIEDIFETLKNEVDHAFEESVELENIAKVLGDKELIRSSKHDESAVESLEKKLQHMINMKKEMEERESTLESLTEHFDDIEHALNMRISLINTVITEAKTGGGTGGASVGPYDCFHCGEDDVLLQLWNDAGQSKVRDEWRCPNCNERLDWGDLDWSSYGDTGSWMMYLPENKKGQSAPWQGWKVHVSCRPSEAKEFIEEMKGKLSKDQHKFAPHPSYMVHWEQEDESNKYKVMTMYASIDSDKEDLILQNFNGQLSNRIVESPSNPQEQTINAAFINSNKERTEKHIEYSLKDALDATIGFTGGEEITSPSYERRLGTSRVHYRYDHIGAYDKSSDHGFCVIGNSYDPSTNQVSEDNILDYHGRGTDQQVLGASGNIVGHYKGSGSDTPDISNVGAENLNPNV